LVVEKCDRAQERAGTGARPLGLFWGGETALRCPPLYQFRLHWNDLTAENAENAESEKREMNNSDEGPI